MRHPTPDPTRRFLAEATGVTSPDGSDLNIPKPLPLPGVIIMVHGVNSDGEWYESTEQGLCAGLNARLARRSGQLAWDGPAAGQITPVAYTDELDPDGFVDRERSDKTFTRPAPHYSPVIRFRWGYKADKEEAKTWGKGVWLNEHDYWGGGPFANGCTTLADLWSEGLNDRLFLWLTVQHMNPAPGRDVYACPPRAYYVHAALRLAKLIASIRARQPDCPVTLVCHSQGNMIGLAAAFLGERFGAVADTYVLANPPYSLAADNFLEHWSQRDTFDGAGRRGRQTYAVRRDTLKAFLDLIRARAGCSQDPASIDAAMANAAPRDASAGFTAEADRACHGLAGHTLGRVTLYCNPHDQVISADTIRGIGWLGLSDAQIAEVAGAGVLTQRVLAQGRRVGEPGRYHYWRDHWKDGGRDGFWHPPPPMTRFDLVQGVRSNTTVFGKVLTVLSAPILYLVGAIARRPVNASPPDDWEIPINAPPLAPFEPQSRRYGQAGAFDEGYDPEAAARRTKTEAERDPGDPYDAHQAQSPPDGSDDGPLGDQQSEARLRYEHRARLRMIGRRSGNVDAEGRAVGEDDPQQASEAYRAWRNRQISAFLDEGVNQNATDHSTSMTNPMHAEEALAYDVAVGRCDLTEADWHELRVEADWRYAKALEDLGHLHAYLSEYFVAGKMKEQYLHDWIKTDPEAHIPGKIVDEREGGAAIAMGSAL